MAQKEKRGRRATTKSTEAALELTTKEVEKLMNAVKSEEELVG